MNLIISEKFYSIQGEGPTSGIPAYFVRLRSCNLMCGGHGTQKDGKLHNGATWRCDTIEVWLKGQETPHKDVIPADIADDIASGKIHLIFTGGEPLLQQQAIEDFLMWFQFEYDEMPIVEVETNGTIMFSKFMALTVDYWNISPKLPNSGMSVKDCVPPYVLESLLATQGTSTVKFVISRMTDWPDIMVWYGHIPLLKQRIILMPACETRGELENSLQIVSHLSKKHRVRMCSRLQIEIWDKKTGV